MNLGVRLRTLRHCRRISQTEVAQYIGITRSAYSHYESNNRQPVYETIIKLAAFFNVSVDYLLVGVDPQAHIKESSEEQDLHEILNLLKRMDGEMKKRSIHMINALVKESLSNVKKEG
jgi:Predicted transcriptional regulators